MSLTLLAIEAPDYGLSDVESLALVAAIFLALAAIVIGLFVGGQYASVKDKLDEIDDRTTLPFAEIHAAVEDDEPETDEIEVVPPTEPSGMPLALESDKLAAERESEKLYRTFTTGDGKVHRFEIKRQP